MNLIHNRFEQVVIQKVIAQGAKYPTLIENQDLLADAACIALNALRPHYIRHALDLSFYLTATQRVQEERQVDAAVKSALERILSDEKASAR